VKRHIPFLLTTLRLLLGPVALAAVYLGWPRGIFLPLLIAGTLSDIYDGVLARRFGVSSDFLRRYDSATDVIYYLFILAATWIVSYATLEAHWLPITLLLGSEGAVIGLSLARFQALPATHTYLAKFYGLALLVCFAALLSFNAPGWIIPALAVVGVSANVEICAILGLSRTPPVDVVSIFTLRR
jgi:CDP-diacylglycerol---glycerol-3-phosphate 3-phosphatidyltransferase